MILNGGKVVSTPRCRSEKPSAVITLHNVSRKAQGWCFLESVLGICEDRGANAVVRTNYCVCPKVAISSHTILDRGRTLDIDTQVDILEIPPSVSAPPSPSPRPPILACVSSSTPSVDRWPLTLTLTLDGSTLPLTSVTTFAAKGPRFNLVAGISWQPLCLSVCLSTCLLDPLHSSQDRRPYSLSEAITYYLLLGGLRTTTSSLVKPIPLTGSASRPSRAYLPHWSRWPKKLEAKER